ncbi:MAG: HAD-IC family P-type ATPase, partial [Verrucomicrobia bacterium]|nr:HAD-IC family P-type ATPase [Verrucomicrobiota bacterium]
LRRSGLFIKSGQIWERLRQVRTVVFDKTGTLTLDIPRLKNPDAVRSLDPLATQALHNLVENNRHPIARSLREALLAAHPKLHTTAVTGIVDENIGYGVAWSDTGGNQWTLGKPDWQRSDKLPACRSVPKQRSDKLPACRPSPGQAGSSPLQPHSCLRQNGLLVASFDFQEDVRDDARNAVDQLRSTQLETIILSGDAPGRVHSIAKQLGIGGKAQCSPRDKATWIERNAPSRALMVGDGANDSLAFDSAVCRGTPVVDKSILEASADFFFFGRSLRCLPELFQVARSRRMTVTTIFTVAVIYNVAAVSICIAGLMHPLLAAILMPLSSLFTLALAWIGLGHRG